MNLTARFATTMSLAVLLALGVPGCAKEKATQKTASAPEAPLSKGYETAIAAHATKPVFRPTGTAPAVWAREIFTRYWPQARRRTMLFSSSKRSYRRAADLRRMCTAGRMNRFTS